MGEAALGAPGRIRTDTAYGAVLIRPARCARYPGSDSNRHWMVFETIASAVGLPGLPPASRQGLQCAGQSIGPGRLAACGRMTRAASTCRRPLTLRRLANRRPALKRLGGRRLRPQHRPLGRGS